MRVAIIGGGISGLTAAYELELARKRGADIDWHLYEASDRLGGIIETTRKDGFILEGGPDGWVSEKPWARDLAIELGLEDQLIYSNDATRKTYILKDGQLLPIPGSMRLMVPTDLAALDSSPLFSPEAKRAYADEPARADELKASAPTQDESVADFTRRHFGDEVLNTLAAPLLSGVFGGDVHKLSVRAVMPQFVAMEREHGSLILALQSKRRLEKPQPIFTSLRDGMATLVEALASKLPPERIHHTVFGEAPGMASDGWRLYTIGVHFVPQRGKPYPSAGPFDHVIVTVRGEALTDALRYVDHDRKKPPPKQSAEQLVPADASSVILVAFAWSAETASTFTIPAGFGFLVPATSLSSRPERSEVERPASSSQRHESQLLACTFVDQKFPHRAPNGGRVLRAFFGGPAADALASATDDQITEAALNQLRQTLGSIPEPTHTTVRRLPRSLPQYEVGHLDRIARLETLVSQQPGLHLLGNAYRGVGLPDLIRDARSAARALTQ